MLLGKVAYISRPLSLISVTGKYGPTVRVKSQVIPSQSQTFDTASPSRHSQPRNSDISWPFSISEYKSQIGSLVTRGVEDGVGDTLLLEHIPVPKRAP